MVIIQVRGALGLDLEIAILTNWSQLFGKSSSLRITSPWAELRLRAWLLVAWDKTSTGKLASQCCDSSEKAHSTLASTVGVSNLSHLVIIVCVVLILLVLLCLGHRRFCMISDTLGRGAPVQPTDVDVHVLGQGFH